MLKRVYWRRNLAFIAGYGLAGLLMHLFVTNVALTYILAILVGLSGIPIGLILPPYFLWRPPTRPAHDTGPPHAPMEH